MKPSTQEKHQPIYSHIKDNGGWDSFSFNILHYHEAINKAELLNQEKTEIISRKPLCNANSPTTTPDERREAKRISSLAWRHANPDKVKAIVDKRKTSDTYVAYVKQRCLTRIDCECGGTYTAQNKSNHLARNIHKEYLKNISNVE
jgi:hypothetical protein